ncbi:MAG: hypothetical protein HYY53_02575 [candidate division NC10 bacterium]|nr:hypothetical protein [candidate division NC10 bacterium]
MELWAKLHGDAISFAVRADTDRWVALLLKDFPHHGMLGDFTDAKVLAAGRVEDFYVAEEPGGPPPAARRRAGVHT